MSLTVIKNEILNFLTECGTNNPDFIAKCEKYKKFLLEENRKYNLTAIKSEEEFWVKHICDSAAIFCENRKLFSLSSKICDIGSGAGFPAAIIAIASDSTVYAVESSKKKAAFITKIASELGLKNLFVLNARAEELNKKNEYKSFFDIITARAVSNLRTIISTSINMLSPNGRFILYKTPLSADNEIEDAKKKFKAIFFEKQKQFSLPLQMGERIFISARRLIHNEK